MNLTIEQQKIVDTIKKDSCDLLKVSSIAGSGKTTLLVELAKTLNPSNGIYLAYNKAIATDASKKFPSNVECMTIHSLAYRNTVKPLRLNLGWFNFKNIKEYMQYEYKLIIIDMMKEFFLSDFLTFEDFKIYYKEKYQLENKLFDIALKYIKQMFSGSIPITHDGYLKLYHMMLINNKIEHNEFDLIMVDEAGDLNPVTLAIFNELPAVKKVMVGDTLQNIYGFNNTINGFKIMKDVGIQLDMTQSFRCEKSIAEKIENFGRRHLEPDFQFKGIEKTQEEINDTKTIAYISRNNSALIAKIIELNEDNVPYNLTRPAKTIFELVLILLNLKQYGKIYSKEWKHLQEDVDEFYMNEELQKHYKKPLKYINHLYGEDLAIKAAMNVINTHGPELIFQSFEQAKQYEKSKNNIYTITTSHSSKGLEFSEIYILDDLNNATERILKKPEEKRTEDDQQGLNLYYIACSRAINKLHNAIWLTRDPEEE